MTRYPVPVDLSWFLAVLAAFIVLSAMLASPYAAVADGRVYSSNHASVSHKLAALTGVYAVWCVTPDDPGRELDFHIVLTPGARAATIAPEVRDIMASSITDSKSSPVVVDIWTYHDPLSGTDFRRDLTDIPVGGLGFPDYRGQKAAVVSAVFPVDSNPSTAVWQIEMAAPGHWANPQTL